MSYLFWVYSDGAILCFAEKGGDPEVIRESQRRRYADVSLVDKVLELDQKWRDGENTRCIIISMVQACLLP